PTTHIGHPWLEQYDDDDDDDGGGSDAVKKGERMAVIITSRAPPGTERVYYAFEFRRLVRDYAQKSSSRHHRAGFWQREGEAKSG
ncbi:hypothetical protein LTR28_001110, partial [Elasticomyces elasticus]